MASVEYNGSEYEYDETALTNYKVAKCLSRAGENPSLAFYAFEKIFNGHDEEYAEQLGGDQAEFGELVKAVIQDAARRSEQAKN